MVKWQPRIRALQLLSAVVIDQILLSAANFFVGFLLIRKTSDSDYGAFVLVQSAVLLLVAAQSAWLSGPLAILAPKRAPDVKREMIGAVEGAQRRFLRRAVVVAICVPALGYALKIRDGFTAVVLTVGVLASWAALQREFLRRVLLIYSRANTLLGADALFAVVFVIGTVIAVLVSKQAVVWTVIAMAVAGWCGWSVAHSALAKDPGWVFPGTSGVFLREIRPLGVWATVGALIYWLFSQGYNYVLASRLDLTAVADVNVARWVIAPAIVFTVGMESLLYPKAAGWLASIGIRRLLERLGVLFVGIAVLETGYFLLVWIFRDWVSHDVLHKIIHDRDRLLILWAGIALIGLLRTVFQSALLALEPLKLMAGISGVGAAVALGLMWFGITRWGPAGALIGQMAGDVAVIIGYTILLRHMWLRGEPRRQ